MRLLPVSVVRPLFLGLAILSCAPERAIGPTLTAGAFRADVSATAASASTVVISQVYGGGGNAGATFKNDFIELFNRSADTVSLTDWSVQYASSTGAFTQKTDLSGKIPPGGYLLVQEAAGAGGSVDLPTPEFTGAIAMAAGSGKVALARIKTLLGCGSAALPCNAAARANMADLVGYGSAANLFEGVGPTTPTLVNTTAAFRKGNGCIDTDENADDFVVGSPFPQNSQTDPTTCGEGSGQEPVTVTVRTSWVTPGTTFKITATAVGNDGRPASPNYTWTTDPTTIATIESATGVAKGISLGVATVTATAPNGVSGTAPLFVVNPGDVASVSVSVNDPKQVPVGFTKPAFPTSRTTTGATVTPELTWSSSDEGIATVSSLGYITGVSAGSAKIRATAPDGVYGEVAFAVIPATAPSTANYGNALEFGTPTDGTSGDEFILTKRQYTESYNSSRGGPNWVSWKINASHFGDAPRCDCFSADQTLPSDFYHVVDFDYRNSGYDRGHIVQSESRTTTDQENASTFLLTNILPQGAENNQGPWSQFENYLNDLARGTAANPTRHEIYVIAGGRYGPNPGTLKNEGKVAIPDYTWKVAVIMDEGKGLADVHLAGDIQVIAIEMPNLTTPGVPASSVGIRNNPWQQYKKTVDEIEAQTGYDVLSALPDGIEQAVESGSTVIPGALLVSPEGVNTNGQGNGQLVVTLLGSSDVDAATVSLESIRAGNVGVDTNGNDGFKSSVKDVNKDGFADLTMHFNRADLVDDGQLTIGTSRLVLYAKLADGRYLEARGPVRVGPGASRN